MGARLWNVLVLAAIGWAVLIGGQMMAVGSTDGNAFLAWCLIGAPPLGLLVLVRYLRGWHS
jgi:hypothetical protein